MFSTFAGALPRTWIGPQIYFILLLWNRLQIFYSFYLRICSSIKEFITIVLDFETCTICLAREVLQFYMRYYMYQENLLPHPTTYSPRKIHTVFSLSEIILYATSRIIKSGTTYFKEKFEWDKSFFISHYCQHI